MGENSPVYDVIAEGDQGQKRVLHRNLLFQCDFLPFEGPQPVKQERLLSGKVKKERLNHKGQEADEANSARYSSEDACKSMAVRFFHE